MLDTILSCCFPVRVARWLVSFWPTSLMGRLCASVAARWRSSAVCRAWNGLLDAEPPGESSLYARGVARLHLALRRLGAFLLVQSRHSFICAALRRCRGALAPLWRGSLFGRLCGRICLRQVLIVCFVLYLPLDVLVREGIGLELLSSLWDEAFLALCVLYVIWRRLFGRPPLRTSVTPLDSPLLLYIGLGIFLMLAVSPDLSIAIAGWRAVFQYMFWFFALVRLFENDGDFRVFYHTVAIMALVLALHGIWQYVVGVPMPAGWTTSTEVGVRTRVYGITSSCNIFACLLLMCAPVVASHVYIFKKLWQKALAWAATGAVCLAILFTFCRGAWLGLMVCVILFALLTDRRILAALFACVPLVTMVPSVANRIAYLFTAEFATANAVGGRGLRWEYGLELFRENLLTGFGLGRFGGAVAMQNQTLADQGVQYFYLDNYYLKVMAEEGLFGILLFGLVLAAILLCGLRGHRRLGHPRSALSVRCAALLSGLAGVMVHMYTENILEVPYMNAYFWGFAAALCWLCFVRGKASLHANRK